MKRCDTYTVAPSLSPRASLLSHSPTSVVLPFRPPVLPNFRTPALFPSLP